MNKIKTIIRAVALIAVVSASTGDVYKRQSLYNRLWRAMRTGSIQFLLDTLDYTNEKKLIRYISQKA